MTPFNDSPNHRRRFDDELGPARHNAGAPSYDEYMADGVGASHDGRGRTPAMFSRAKDSVQRGISGATDYVKSRGMEDVLEDARAVVRRNPRVAIVALVAVGFLVGRMMRRPR